MFWMFNHFENSILTYAKSAVETQSFAGGYVWVRKELTNFEILKDWIHFCKNNEPPFWKRILGIGTWVEPIVKKL